MPPGLALLLTCGFIAWLFLRDEGRQVDSSPALWLPFSWLFITGTRFLSQWIALGRWTGSPTSTDGSTLDAIVFGALTLAGYIVLARRRLEIGKLVRQNPWIIGLLLYGLVSIAWSDFPFISFKRWIKALGNPVMALVILTDRNPSNAFRIVIRRLAYVVLPLSVTFIKYFPEFGRGFDFWTGRAFNQGVALDKNGLGQLCLVIGLGLVWNTQVIRRIAGTSRRPAEWWVTAGLLAMLLWLLYISDSKTSLVALLLGIGVLVVLKRFPAIRARFLVSFISVALILLLVETTFHVYGKVIVALGRNPDLTDRTAIWADVLAQQPNVLLGAGYEAFWLGDRLRVLWSIWRWQPNQAHSGYIEMYANGGLLGLGLMLGMIASAFRSIAKDLRSSAEIEVEWARLRMAALLVIVVYNYTEATFRAVNMLWTLFYVVAWTVDSRAYEATRHWRSRPAKTSKTATARTAAGSGRPGPRVKRPWYTRTGRT